MDLLKDLNKEQQRAVTYNDGPLLIVAGAGTGKTTVITRRFAWLILSKKAKPEEVLAITFTDKAAEEMEERIDQLLPLGLAPTPVPQVWGCTDLWVSTFHAFCERILRNHALDIGLSTDFKLLNTTEQWLLIRKHWDEFHLDYYRPLGNSTKFIYVLLNHFSRAKDEVISPEDYLEYTKNTKLDTDSAERGLLARRNSRRADNKLNLLNINGSSARVSRGAEYNHSITTNASCDLGSSASSPSDDLARLEEVASAYHTYEQLKLKENALDFGDLINYSLKLFQKRPGILEQYRQQFKYILVDEFQDTNWAQYELMKLLAAPKNNLTVVADDDQSVYAFRGASMSNILHFKDDYPKACAIVLTDNYRNKQNVLDLSYDFVQQNNPNRLESTLKIPKKLKASRNGPGIIEHLHLRTQAEEAGAVAKKILEFKEQNPKLSFNDFAILVRANNHAETFIAALDAEEIPYQFLASSGLYSKPVILDIIAYLKLLDNYHESTAAYRVLNFAFLKIAYDDLVKLNHISKKKNWSIYEAMGKAAAIGISTDGVLKISRVLRLIEKHTSIARQKSIGKVVFAFLEDSEYLKNISSAAEKGDIRAIENVNYLNQFFRKIEEFEHIETEPTVKNFISNIDLLLQAGEAGSLSKDWEQGPEAVKILTVHGAKGLEFSYVFICNLVDLRFPSSDRKEPIKLPDPLVKEIVTQGDTHLEEERRLFYVAMTRARDGLFFTSAEDYGGMRKKKLSRFLFELGYAKPEIKKSTGKVLFQQKVVLPSSLQPTTYNLPATFSYTQLKAFETCPLQYKFAHILYVPVKGKASFSFGKSIHLTLQRFFQKVQEARKLRQGTLFAEADNADRADFADPHNPPKSAKSAQLPENLLKIYDQVWIDEWYEDKKQQEEYKKKGREILKQYWEQIKDNLPEILFLEKPFRIKIGEHTLKGVIDRIDSVESRVIIVDYKTGRRPEKSSDIDKVQLLIYQIAATKALNLQPTALEFHYLNDQSKFSFLGEEKDLKAIEEKVINTIEKIKKSDFKPTPSNQKCRYCDFKEICEYRALS